jgi:hypothetical protein
VAIAAYQNAFFATNQRNEDDPYAHTRPFENDPARRSSWASGIAGRSLM